MNKQSIKDFVEFHQSEIIGYVITPAVCLGLFVVAATIIAKTTPDSDFESPPFTIIHP